MNKLQFDAEFWHELCLLPNVDVAGGVWLPLRRQGQDDRDLRAYAESIYLILGESTNLLADQLTVQFCGELLPDSKKTSQREGCD